MNKKVFFLAPLVIAALMAGCGGSDSSDAPTPAPTSTPTPTPRPTPAPTPTPSTPSASFAYEGRWQMACHISSSRVQAGQVAYKSSIFDVTITRRPDGLYAWTETEREYLGQACQGQPVKTETETGYMQIADRVTLSDGTQADRLYIWETTDNNRDKDLARIEGERLYITGFGDNVDDRLSRDAQGWPTALNRTVWHQRQP